MITLEPLNPTPPLVPPKVTFEIQFRLPHSPDGQRKMEAVLFQSRLQFEGMEAAHLGRRKIQHFASHSNNYRLPGSVSLYRLPPPPNSMRYLWIELNWVSSQRRRSLSLTGGGGGAPPPLGPKGGADPPLLLGSMYPKRKGLGFRGWGFWC